ncbi:MAG: cytidine deaminase [Defluviitaleaceae bacterium]|nr:cytidine deaminase [Defluviitaleaceae bacterium]
MNYKELAVAALEARKLSYSPYSNFQVGAALLTKSGKIYKGCNIESAAFSPTNCAERTALFKAISEGEREFAAIAVAGGAADGEAQYCYPCGVCRQMLGEFFTADCEIIVVKTEDDFLVHSFAELLPFGFGAGNLI